MRPGEFGYLYDQLGFGTVKDAVEPCNKKSPNLSISIFVNKEELRFNLLQSIRDKQATNSFIVFFNL